jgi:nucleotide-binding universal stress UspA family protein
MKKILIAAEGGPLTETVVQHEIKLAKLLNAEIGFIYAADATVFIGESGYTTQNYLEDLPKEARDLIEKLKSEFHITQNWAFIKDGSPPVKNCGNRPCLLTSWLTTSINV